MCIIATMEAGISLPKENFDKCAEGNSHGFGMMYAFEGKVFIYKTMDANEMWRAYQSLLDTKVGAKAPVCLHFRFSTSGSDSVYSAHPFWVINNNLAFCHNGVMSEYTEKVGPKSDTQHFCEKILKPLGMSVVNNEATMELVENHIGKSNKLVFLDSRGKFTYANKEQGTYDEDLKIWFSNYGYKIYPPTTTSATSTTTTNSIDMSKCFICKEAIGKIGDKENGPYGVNLQSSKRYLHVCPKCASIWTLQDIETYYDQTVGNGVTK